LKALHKFYDVDGDGNISYHEFVNALSDNKMSKRKTDMVDKAWSILDREGKGELTGEQILAAKKEDSECFNGMAKVTVDDFLQHYREVAMQIPNDDYFVQKIESTWKDVVEDIHAPVKRDKVMHIIKLMRHRLTTVANNSQEEYVLRDIFRTFDLDKSGCLTLNEMAGLLAKLGVAVNEKELLALMREMDSNNSGVIEFEEFCQFMVLDPWK
jgi:Ca2+-binding EF-hand superfamily protein